jgi:hypothetical protein
VLFLCHSSDLLCWLTVIWPPLIPWAGCWCGGGPWGIATSVAAAGAAAAVAAAAGAALADAAAAALGDPIRRLSGRPP